MGSPQYRTVVGELRHEIDKIKGSRFIATIAPAESVDAATAFVTSVRKEFHDARHTCWAYRIGDRGETFRSSDDGEPSGSAGKPILAQVDGQGLCYVVVAVTRYFGGTKLGVGGLVRAYGQAAAEAIARASIRTVVLTRRVRIEHPYECSSAIEALLAAEHRRPAAADYTTSVRLEFDIPEDEVDSFVCQVRDRTGDRATITVLDSPAP